MKRFVIAAFAATLPYGPQRDAFAQFARDKPQNYLEAFIAGQENRRRNGEPVQPAPRRYAG
ncbi:hypothetical protein [Qipengyuania psychrotolerans]|uniref:Uncharacterized protein n=1 Tax=Qipengyuania psychrotolerans TaxID=2867238 RepID=A0ABX8ZCQ7_9SPHN|nr:hypothetical protein [Qipengyuania psychrotolerans]QZD86679.1 hypothetical protein K3166_10730 [Qipengyuania psychrotolerans]